MRTETNARLCMMVLVVWLVGFAGSVSSDCGSIPFSAPFLQDPLEVRLPTSSDRSVKTVAFDPLKVTVFEPQQRAIILWNGREEILLLSTDQRASQKSAILEVIPLPSQPTIRLGSFKTFEQAQRLMVEKRMWACAHGGAAAGLAPLPESAGRITFQEKLGAHDLSVAEVRDAKGFVGFVQDYLRERYKTPEAPIRPEFVSIIESYLDEGFRWFAFDVIELDSASAKSREPIEYRFQSDAVFYPLRISSLEGGKTRVDHLVFTAKDLASLGGPTRNLRREPALPCTRQEVEALDENWRGFFGTVPSLTLNQWSIEGESARLLSDVRAK